MTMTMTTMMTMRFEWMQKPKKGISIIENDPRLKKVDDNSLFLTKNNDLLRPRYKKEMGFEGFDGNIRVFPFIN